MAGPARYLDPAVLARLGSLDLKAKTVVEGVLSGLHRSPRRGFSVEYARYADDAFSRRTWYRIGEALGLSTW